MQEKIENKKMTYEEFLAWCDEDTLAEWVDGKIIYYSLASFKHQKIVDFLSKLLGIYVEMNNLGEVLIAPFQMKLEHSGREPDILFIKKERLSILNTNYIDGPADLVIEVVSPDSRKRDTQEKLKEYERAKIKEYWLIDYENRTSKFFILEKDRYKEAKHKEAKLEGSIYHSGVIEGFWLDVNWLFQEPLPNVQKTIIKIGGKKYIKLLRDILEEA